MPGGLKGNLEHYLGRKLRIDKSESRDVVYRNIDRYAVEKAKNLLDILEVLNCAEGCNKGTACDHSISIFEIN